MTRRLAAAPDQPRRAGAYVRVSALMGRAGEDFLSPTIQLDTIKSAVDRDPVPTRLVEVWEDIDRSGRTMIRPGLEAAVQAARAGDLDVLYVYDLSRWARNAADGLAELAAIERLGVPVVSATEGNVDRSTSSGKLTAGLLLLLAEHKSDIIGDQWRRVMQVNAERGILHGRAPLGYVRSSRRTVEVDPVMGPAMVAAFHAAANGTPILEIGRQLGALRGRAVGQDRVRALLASPVFLGLVPFKGRTYPGRHEALIDQDTFDRVQARLKASAQLPPRTQDARHALAGLAYCAGCGRGLWRRIGSGAKQREPFYACRTNAMDGSRRCPGIGTPRIIDVEAVVLAEVRARYALTADTSAAYAAEQEARQVRAVIDRRRLLDEIAKNEKAIGELVARHARGEASDLEKRLGLVELERTLTMLRDRERHVSMSAERHTFEEARSLAEALLTMWPDMTVKEQSRALRAVVRGVVVTRAKVWREPLEPRTWVVLLDP